jgi:hypothetical protein
VITPATTQTASPKLPTLEFSTAGLIERGIFLFAGCRRRVTVKSMTIGPSSSKTFKLSSISTAFPIIAMPLAIGLHHGTRKLVPAR